MIAVTHSSTAQPTWPHVSNLSRMQGRERILSIRTAEPQRSLNAFVPNRNKLIKIIPRCSSKQEAQIRQMRVSVPSVDPWSLAFIIWVEPRCLLPVAFPVTNADTSTNAIAVRCRCQRHPAFINAHNQFLRALYLTFSVAVADGHQTPPSLPQAPTGL